MSLFETPQAVTLEDAVALIGAECVAYVVAGEVADLEALSERALSAPQKEALDKLLLVLGSPIVQSPRRSELKVEAAVSLLTAFDPAADTTLANVLRLEAGGGLPEIPEGDPVEQAAAHLARDSYPALLVPDDQRLGTPMSKASTFRNPWTTRFQEAVLADEELGQRFVGPADGDAASFPFTSSTGHGEGGVQLVLLADRILGTPAAICRARRGSAAEFVAAAVQAVSHLRRLVVLGRTVRSPTLIGFDAVRVPPDTSLETPWGLLRALTDGERDLLRGFGGPGNAVLVTEFPVKLFMNEEQDGASLDRPAVDAMFEARAALEERARMFAFALLLAIDLPMPAGIGLRYTLIEDPFGWMPSISGRFDEAPRSPVELTRAELEDVARWIGLVEANHHASMSVAVRRTLLAHERTDATDAFIDAVIAWDALFGARSGDAVTFRVALGFSLVLEDAEDERRHIKRRVQELYGLRSDLVHGAVTELHWREAGQRREEAVQLLRRALRVLYEDHADVLAADDRTTDLALRLGT
jgi:hypothetical protein